MNNIYRLIIFLPLFMLGCVPNVVDENKVIQKIDSLDMNIYSKRGDKIYSITSPHSTFDNNALKFQFKNTTINIFHLGETKYIIDSDESTLSDNNKFIELKGNVKLKTINQDDDYLYADNFIWNLDDKNESKYETNSENAYYDIDKESLSFRAKDKRVRSKIYF